MSRNIFDSDGLHECPDSRNGGWGEVSEDEWEDGYPEGEVEENKSLSHKKPQWSALPPGLKSRIKDGSMVYDPVEGLYVNKESIRRKQASTDTKRQLIPQNPTDEPVKKRQRVISFVTAPRYSCLQRYLWENHREWASPDRGTHTVGSMVGRAEDWDVKCTAWTIPEEEKYHFYTLLERFSGKHYFTWTGRPSEDPDMGLAFFMDVDMDLMGIDVVGICSSDDSQTLVISGEEVKDRFAFPRWIADTLKSLIFSYTNVRPALKITTAPYWQNAPWHISHHVHVWELFLHVGQMRFLCEQMSAAACNDITITNVDFPCSCGANCTDPKCSQRKIWKEVFDTNVYARNETHLRVLSARKATWKKVIINGKTRRRLQTGNIPETRHSVVTQLFDTEERAAQQDVRFANDHMVTDVSRHGPRATEIPGLLMKEKKSKHSTTNVDIQSVPVDVKEAVIFLKNMMNCDINKLTMSKKHNYYNILTDSLDCPRHNRKHQSNTVHATYFPETHWLTLSCFDDKSKNDRLHWVLVRTIGKAVFLPKNIWARTAERNNRARNVSVCPNMAVTTMFETILIDVSVDVPQFNDAPTMVLIGHFAASDYCILSGKTHNSHCCGFHVQIPSYKYGGEYHMRWTYYCDHRDCKIVSPLQITWIGNNVSYKKIPRRQNVKGRVNKHRHHDQMANVLNFVNELFFSGVEMHLMPACNQHPDLWFYRVSPPCDLTWNSPEALTTWYTSRYVPFVEFNTDTATTILIASPMGDGKSVAGATFGRHMQRLLARPPMRKIFPHKKLLTLVCRVAHSKNFLQKLTDENLEHDDNQRCDWKILLDELSHIKSISCELHKSAQTKVIRLAERVDEYIQLRGTDTSYQNAANLVITIHSLVHFVGQWEAWPVVFIDEATKVLFDVVSSNIIRKFRVSIMAVIGIVLTKAMCVVLMDADLDQWVVDFVAKFRDVTKFTIIRKVLNKTADKKCFIVPDADLLIDTLARQLPLKEAAFFFDSKMRHDNCVAQYLQPILGEDGLLSFTSDSSNEDVLANEKDTRTITATPGAFSALDIKRPLDYTLSDFSGRSAIYTECAQAPARARNCDTHWIALRRQRPRDQVVVDKKDVLKELDKTMSRHEWIPQVEAASRMPKDTSMTDPWFDVWLQHHIMERQHKNDFPGYLAAAIEKNGMPVYAIHPHALIAWKAFNQTLTPFETIDVDLTLLKAIQVQRAPIIFGEEINLLKVKNRTTLEDYILERYEVTKYVGPLHFCVDWYIQYGQRHFREPWRKFRLLCMTPDARDCKMITSDDYHPNVQLEHRQIRLLVEMMECLNITLGQEFVVVQDEMVNQTKWNDIISRISSVTKRCRVTLHNRHRATTIFKKMLDDVFGGLCTISVWKKSQFRTNDKRLRKWIFRWTHIDMLMSTLACRVARKANNGTKYSTDFACGFTGVSSAANAEEQHLISLF